MNKLIGNTISEARKKCKLTQEKLGKTCNLDRTYISAIERGRVMVTAVTLFKIANALKIDLNFLSYKAGIILQTKHNPHK